MEVDCEHERQGIYQDEGIEEIQGPIPLPKEQQDEDFVHYASPFQGEPSVSASRDSGYGEGSSQNLICHEQFDTVEWQASKLSLHSPNRWTPYWPMSDRAHAGFEGFEEEIYRHRLAIERKFHPIKCLEQQPEIGPGMRALLVNWVTTQCQRSMLSQGTLFLSVNIIDRVFSVIFVSNDCLPLLGITAMLVASKLEEVQPPEISDLLVGTNYTRESVKKLEQLVLMAIRFNLMVPTSHFFLEYFAACCIVNKPCTEAEKLKQARAFARCILQLSLQDYDLCQFRPSLLALCTWKAALRQLNTSDGEFYPSGIYCTRGRYDKCLSEVESFTATLVASFPDIENISEAFRNLNGTD